MRYCYNCGRITIGQPVFCNFCGRSYNVKLCPRLHANPRNAEVCSQCGSRDLSTPQPRVPLWTRLAAFFLSLVPGLLLAALSILAVVFFIQLLLHNPNILLALVFLGIAFAVLSWAWAQLPAWFRKAIYRMLQRKRKGDRQ